MTKGIEQITAAVKILAKFGNVTGAVLEDGKLDLRDIQHIGILQSVLPEFWALVTNPTELLVEYKDLSREEVQTLVTIFKQEFDIPQDKIEERIEQAAQLLDLVHASYEAIAAFASAIKK